MATDSRDREPTPANATSSTDDEHADHLERSRTVWDRWSDWYEMSESDLEPMREAAIDRLALHTVGQNGSHTDRTREAVAGGDRLRDAIGCSRTVVRQYQPGDRVLEIGCGPGVNFERIRNDIGKSGELVAVDYSPEIIANAQERIDSHGWENVEVRRTDATTATFEEPFDAALATLSLSVMPDVPRAIETVYRSLVPDSTFVVFDVRPFPDGPARVLDPFVWRFLRWYANWNPDGDVAESLDTVFDANETVDTYTRGTTYTVVCEKHDSN